MATKRLHPGPGNREEVIAATLKEILRSEERRRTSITYDEKSCSEHWLPARHVRGVIDTCATLFYDRMSLAIPKIWQGDDEGMQFFASGAGAMYVAARLDFCDLHVRTDGFDLQNPVLKHLLMFHGVAAKTSGSTMPNWLAPYLLKLLNGKSSELLRAIDKPFVEFMRQLMQAETERRWPGQFDTEELKGFASLLQFADKPTEFREVLENYCDFRLCNAWGWDSVDAQKPRKPSQSFPSSVFDGPGWEALLPFELFSLQYVYEYCTGKALSLSCGHPLLQSKLMSLPCLWPFPKNDLLAAVEAFGSSMFGDNWQESKGSN